MNYFDQHLRERLTHPGVRAGYLAGTGRRGKCLLMAHIGIAWTEVPIDMRPKIPWGPHVKRRRRNRR